MYYGDNPHTHKTPKKFTQALLARKRDGLTVDNQNTLKKDNILLRALDQHKRGLN